MHSIPCAAHGRKHGRFHDFLAKGLEGTAFLWDNTNWYVFNQKDDNLKKENQEAMIATQNVSLSYSGKPLFKNVNIKFTAGNCYGIIGANGTGKSTFLKVLSGEL